MTRHLRIFSILFSVAVMLCACAPRAPESAAPVVIRRAEAVPYPGRPAFPAFVDGDFACQSVPARERLARRHTQLLWYLNELETALAAYDMQTGPDAPAP